MKRFGRITRRVLLVIAVILALLVGGVVIFAHTDYANRRLRDEVTRVLSEDFGLEATFGTVELEFLPPRVHVQSTRVNGADEEPLVTVDRITIGLQPAALLQGKIDVSEITLEEPTINLVIEGHKVVNLPALRSSEGGESNEERQKIRDLGVLAGRVNIEVRDARGGPLRVVLDDTNVDLTMAPGDVTEVRLLIAGGSVEQGENHHEINLVRGRAMFREGQMILRQFRLRIEDLRVDVPRATVGLEAPFDIVGSAEVWVPLELVRELPVRAPPLRGNAHVVANVERENERIEADGRLEIAGLIIGPQFMSATSETTYGPHVIGDVSGDFHYDPDRLTMGETTIDRPGDDGSILVSNLRIGLSEERIPLEAELELSDLELGRVLIDAGLSASRVRARIFGRTTVHGYLRDEFTLRCEPTSLHVRNFAVLTENMIKDNPEVILAIVEGLVQGKVVIDGRFVRLRNMTVSFGRSVLSVWANLPVTDPLRWRLVANTPAGRDMYVEDVGDIAGLHIGGHGQVNATIQGTYGDPTVDGRVDLQEFELGPIPFGRIRGSLRYRQLVIDLPLIRGERARSSYQFENGRVDFRRRLTVNGLAHFDPLYLSEGVEMFGIEGGARQVEGLARGRAEVTYLGGRERWLVNATAGLEETSFAGTPLGNGEVEVEYDTGDVNVRSLALRREGSEARIVGEMGRNGQLDMEVSLSNLPLGAIDPLPEVIRDIQGSLRGRARILGTTRFPRASGWAELSPLIHRGTRFDPSRVRFSLEGDELHVEGDVGGRMIHLDELRVRLTRPYPLWVRGAVQGLRFGDILGHDVLPEGLGIALDATLDAGMEVGPLLSSSGSSAVRARHGPVTIWGGRHRELGLSGWIRVDSIEADHPAFTVRNGNPVRLSLEQNRATFREATPFSVYSSTLRQATDVSLAGWASFDQLGLELEGELDLAFVPALLDDVSELVGTALVDCSFRGEPQSPALLGTASVNLDRLVLAGLERYPASNLTGRLRFTRNVVLLEDVLARVLGGEVAGSGRVTLSGLSLSDYHLQANVRDASLSLGPQSGAVLNGTVTLDSPAVGAEQLPVVGGQLTVMRLRYEEPIELVSLDGIGGTRRTVVQTYDRERDSIRLDLRLTGSDNLRIENNLAEAGVLIDDVAQPFRVIGTNQYQTARGTLRLAPHGTLIFRDMNFDIDRGILDFTDPFELNPGIDLVATAVRREWVITLRVTGSLNEPVIALSSDPPLADADIRLLLTVGLTREETEQMGYLSAASGVIPELLWSLSGVDDEVSRLLAMDGETPLFDEFRITTEYSSRTGRPEPRIRVGRRLSPSIRLGASAGLSEARDFEANLEYRVNEGLSLGVAYENDSDFNLGNIGGDLRWRTEF